tara:strand:+ start:27 stop:476 length:450 start_codon:yes stop_codon:yes gene_type:complete
MDIEQEVIDCVNDLVNKVYDRERNRIYREKNKEKLKQKQKEYQQKISKEKRKQYNENTKEYQKQYNQSSKGKKIRKISHWKSRGIITDNYDQLYNHYLKTAYCDACRVKLTYDRYNTATTKVVDHDHKITDAPNFRNILCHICNIKRRY